MADKERKSLFTREQMRTLMSGAFDMCACLKEKILPTLRESRQFNEEWFNNYLAMVQFEARKLGKEFRFYSEEGNGILYIEKQLEMYRFLVGYLKQKN